MLGAEVELMDRMAWTRTGRPIVNKERVMKDMVNDSMQEGRTERSDRKISVRYDQGHSHDQSYSRVEEVTDCSSADHHSDAARGESRRSSSIVLRT